MWAIGATILAFACSSCKDTASDIPSDDIVETPEPSTYTYEYPTEDDVFVEASGDRDVDLYTNILKPFGETIIEECNSNLLNEFVESVKNDDYSMNFKCFVQMQESTFDETYQVDRKYTDDVLKVKYRDKNTTYTVIKTGAKHILVSDKDKIYSYSNDNMNYISRLNICNDLLSILDSEILETTKVIINKVEYTKFKVMSPAEDAFDSDAIYNIYFDSKHNLKYINTVGVEFSMLYTFAPTEFYDNSIVEDIEEDYVGLLPEDYLEVDIETVIEHLK